LFPRRIAVINAKRSATSDTALRLPQVTGMSADGWIGLQQEWDLWHALRSKEAIVIARSIPLRWAG
jgi:antitoxin HigA-1